VLPSNPTPTLEAILKDLNKQNDVLSSEISGLIKKGDLDKIQEKINREIRRLSTLPENLAFYSYIQGSLYLVQQKYLLAERSLNLAVALAPDNCKYRGLFATTLISLDRYAEANRIAGENVGEARTCSRSKDILERSRILLAQTYIAIENQDEPATIRLIHAFETSLRPLSSNKPPMVKLVGSATLACAMEFVIQSTWGHDLLKLRKFGSSDLCDKLSKYAGNNGIAIRSMFSAGVMLNGGLGPYQGRNLNTTPAAYYDQANRSATIEEFSNQIKQVESTPDIQELGFDQTQQSITLGRLFFLRGASQMKLFNFGAAREDLRLSYAKLKPFASLEHPEAFSTYATIALTSYVFDSPLMSTDADSNLAIVDNSEEAMLQVIREVTQAKNYDVTPQTCSAILTAYVSLEVADFVSFFDLSKKMDAEEKTRSPNPDLQRGRQLLRIAPASLDFGEDKNAIKSKFSSCMKEGLSRNSLLYEEFLVAMQRMSFLDTVKKIPGVFQEEKMSEPEKEISEKKAAITFEEIYTKSIATYDHHRGFPKYYETHAQLRRDLVKRAFSREVQAKYDDARSDLEKAVELSQRFGSKHEVMQALGSLSSLVMRHFNEPAVTASHAQEAFTNGVEYISTKSPHTCMIVAEVSAAGNKAARRWFKTAQWDKAAANLQQVVEIGELHAPSCIDMGIKKSGERESMLEAIAIHVRGAQEALEVMNNNDGKAYLGRALPIDSDIIKKYKEKYLHWEEFGLLVKKWKGRGTSDLDNSYPPVLELIEVARSPKNINTQLQ
jgi:tetratricopeptide (TPR) repeat protein